MKEIQLTQGKVAFVDNEDFEVLSAVKWFAYSHRRTFYARRNRHQPDGKWIAEHMHRTILENKMGRPIAKGMECDHINGDGLDNRRENLREVTGGQNMRNCRRHSASPSSQYLGVTWDKSREKWLARIQVNGKPVHLGYHATELAAAQAREAYVLAHPELNARLNLGGQIQIKE